MLSKEQVHHIIRTVRRRNFKSFSLEEELIDFVSCEVEARVSNGEPFEEALSEVIDGVEVQANSKHPNIDRLSKPNSIDMLRNYFKVALRNFSRYRVNSAINIFGLVLSLTVAVIIGLYLKYEYSFDKGYPDVDRLYRINTISNLGETPTHMTSVSLHLLPTIKETIPEVEASSNLSLAILNQPLKWNGNTFSNYQMAGVSEDFPHMLDVKEVKGSISRAFNTLNTVLVSESRAQSIFGNIDPIGQVVEIRFNDKDLKFEVAGVFEDLPVNTHFAKGKYTDFSFLISMETLEGFTDNRPSWNTINGAAYVKISSGASVEDVSDKINEQLVNNTSKNIWYEHYLQPISDIHLNKNEYGIGSEGNLGQLKLLVLIGIIIVIIACINYVNLTTAQASVRLKEVGIRKVIGAQKRQFIIQFLVESTLISLLSMGLAFVLVLLLIPVLNDSFSLGLNLNLTKDLISLIGFLVLILVVSLLCGTYPGWYLSNVKANVLLKTGSAAKAGGGIFRKALVALQYTTSITLIVATLIMTNQMNYLSQKDLGFNKEQVVYIPLDYRISTKYGGLLYDEIVKESGVVVASLTGSSLGDGGMSSHGVLVGDLSNGSNGQMLQVLAVDDGLKDVLGLEVTEGRWFSAQYGSDRAEGFVVNEAFVNHFGLDDPVGVPLSRNGQKGKILGVVKDYHFKSMHTAIEPLVMYENDRSQFGYWNIAVRLAPNSTANTLGQLEEIWSSVISDYPFSYSFLDDKIDQYYKSDQNFAVVFKVFSSIAIAVSCLGLIGLVAFTTQRRAKEIGVRKVLGASIGTILGLLSKEYLKLILLAALVAIPVVYYVMNNWLANFEYRIGINAYVFVLGFLITLVLSWLSVGYLSFRAAKSNPVDSLRAE